MGDFKIENRNGIIFLSGKVDSNNAAEFEKQLMEIGKGKLTLDLCDFSYISSAGLRVLLKAVKAKNELKIVNVPDEVYEIFEMTGFTSILDISKKRRTISIEGCEQISQGGTCRLYRLDDETVVKVFNQSASEDFIKRELEHAHQAFLLGLPTAIAFDVVNVDGSNGIVYEMFKSKTLAQELMEHPESFDELMERFVALLKQVHSTKVQSGALPRMSDTYRTYLEAVSKWLTADEVGKVEKMIDSIPDRDTLVHGDFHAKNIMIVNGELALIDMVDTSIGHPIYDFVSISNAYQQLPKRMPQACLPYLGLSPEMASKAWERILELYFDGASADTRAKLAQLIGEYTIPKYVFTPASGSVRSEEMLNRIIKRSKEELIPKIDEVIAHSDLLWKYL